MREQQFDAKTPAWLAEQTGAKVAVIGTMANSLPGTETFIKLSRPTSGISSRQSPRERNAAPRTLIASGTPRSATARRPC